MKKALKITAIVSLTIGVIIAGIGWYVRSNLESIVLSQLYTQTKKLSNGLYKLSVEHLGLQLRNKSFEIKGIKLEVDQAVLQELQKQGETPDLLFDISLETLLVKGIRYNEYRKNKHLDIRLFELSHPVVTIHQYSREKRDTASGKSLYQQLSPAMAALIVRNIQLNNGVLHYYAINGTDTASYHVKNIDLKVSDVLIDSTSPGPFYCKDLQLNLQHFQRVLPSKLYELNIQRIVMGLKDSSLVLEHFQLSPQYSKHLFAQKDPKHSDWMELEVSKINVVGLDIQALLLDKLLRADSLQIQGVDFKSFKNKNVEHVPRVKPMFYAALQKAPIAFQLNSLSLINGNVVYEELPLAKSVPGVISFNSISINCKGATNIVSQKDQYLTVLASAKLMNTGKMYAMFKLPVDSLNDHFAVSGHLASMPMNALNSILEPLLITRIKTGRIQKVDFSIDGNSRTSKTTMLLLYNDFQISLLKEKNNQTHKLGFASRLANIFVIRSNNPPTGKQAQAVQASAHRNVNRSSFNFLWRSIFSGVKVTMGLTEERESRLRNIQTNVKQFKPFSKKKE